jgi:hypothetical protein
MNALLSAAAAAISHRLKTARKGGPSHARARLAKPY